MYKYSIQNSNDYQDWFKLSGVYDSTVDPQERILVLDAIAQSRSQWIIDSVCLECLWTNSNDKIINVRPQDFFTILTYMGRSPNGRYYAWYFIRHYWYDLVKSFGLTNRSFANALKGICESFSSELLIEEVSHFIFTVK